MFNYTNSHIFYMFHAQMDSYIFLNICILTENCILFIAVLQSTIQFVSFGRYKPESTVSANATDNFSEKKTTLKNILNK